MTDIEENMHPKKILLYGTIINTSEHSVEIEFDVDGFSEIREYPLESLNLHGRKPEKHDRVKCVWSIELLPPTPGMTDEELKRWKEENRWKQRSKLRRAPDCMIDTITEHDKGNAER